MNKLSTLTAIAVFSATTVSAGSVVFTPPVSIDVVAAAPQLVDWSGVYVGATGALGQGKEALTVQADGRPIVPVRDLSGSMFGGFAGYNFQRGAMVFGVEAAYSVGSIGDSFVDPNQEGTYNVEYTAFTDLKARVGFATGKALVYGFAGWSMGDFTLNDAAITQAFPQSGMNYGAGVDFRIGGSWFVGAEVIFRNMSGDTNVSPMDIDAVDSTIQAVQIRAGITF